MIDAYVESAGKASMTFVARGLPSTAAERADGAIALGAMFRATHSGAGYGIDVIADLRTGDVVARFAASGYDASRAADVRRSREHDSRSRSAARIASPPTPPSRR